MYQEALIKLSSDTIRTGNYIGGITYTVGGKLVHDSDGSLANPLSYGFSIPNDNLEGYTFNRTNGHWDSVSKAEALSVWNAMKPYMRQKGIYFGESWK
ncbi:MAG: hypothetical protein SPL62_13010 [Selenomonas sp.]|uniref:hypothetical protein n=1 Tax=uncultured Selenomonas sp. TaxID=159275 RepID=UPI002600CF56|nr:hypothetical protein [uncultured Selenomonas sp.]MDY6351398.1 hypothetical protein [Selenomonas sp.]